MMTMQIILLHPPCNDHPPSLKLFFPGGARFGALTKEDSSARGCGRRPRDVRTGQEGGRWKTQEHLSAGAPAKPDAHTAGLSRTQGGAVAVERLLMARPVP